MSVTCVIQARTGSSRLPGKVLQPIAGRPMLGFMLHRLRSLRVDALIVATSDLERDDPIEELAQSCGVAVVRGSEHDVLGRFVTAMDACPSDHVVRLTADCPLSDARLIEAVIETHICRAADYTSNVLSRHYPKGLDVEVVASRVLRVAADEATEAAEREHVTPFVYRRPERFAVTNHSGPAPLGHERWTVDTADDLAFVRTVVDQLPDLDAGWEAIHAIIGQRERTRPGEVTLRPATAGDSARILAWRNDVDAVRWSTTGCSVAEADHARWFSAVLENAGRRIWIGEVDGTPIGTVRVDVRSGVGTVSVAVDAARRGHGAGSGMLRSLQRELLDDCQVVELRALVHPANARSQRIFERSGFRVEGVDAATGFVALGCDRRDF